MPLSVTFDCRKTKSVEQPYSDLIRAVNTKGNQTNNKQTINTKQTTMVNDSGFACKLSLSRTSYFPGNQIAGVLSVTTRDPTEFHGLRVAIQGVACVRWPLVGAKAGNAAVAVNWRREVFSRTVVHIAGDVDEAVAAASRHRLPAGQQDFPFSALLSPQAAPSARVSALFKKHPARILWEIVTEVGLPGVGWQECGHCFFTVLSPLPSAVWQAPSAVTVSSSTPVKSGNCQCCGNVGWCCFAAVDNGSVQVKVSLDKTTVALDRDRIVKFTVKIDNTAGENDVQGITVGLQCVCVPKFQSVEPLTAGSPYSRRLYLSSSVPANVPAGQVGEVTGQLDFSPTAHDLPPTVESSVMDFKNQFVVSLRQSGCCVVDTKVSAIDFTVGHSVLDVSVGGGDEEHEANDDNTVTTYPEGDFFNKVISEAANYRFPKRVVVPGSGVEYVDLS